MNQVLPQMAALIACGILWRFIKPPGMDADSVRRVITGLVYTLLLPALVLSVLWKTSLGLDTFKIALTAAAGVIAALAVILRLFRQSAAPATSVGALILAAAFPNATYLGLPVLEKTFGPWARSIAIQYDLFACTPLLLTVGILIARRHGGGGERTHILTALLKVPPLWAALAAMCLNLAGVPLPGGLEAFLQTLANGVIPLMLIALGMALSWETRQLQRLSVVLPVLAVQLLGMPLLAWGLSAILGLHGDMRTAVVLEAAMPSMVLGVVICDRYGLDTRLYATTVTASTALSFFTLPLWFHWVQSSPP
ncbi:MAG: AEC family transporter [Gammaproteobacteria bacterium]|jgi:predicted permease